MSASSAVVRMRWLCPWYAGESLPGIHGGITRSFVISAIAWACSCALFAFVSENGAMPPVRWQLTHFDANTGATVSHVGAAARLVTVCCDPSRAAVAIPTPARVAVAAAATRSRRRCIDLSCQRARRVDGRDREIAGRGLRLPDRR